MKNLLLLILMGTSAVALAQKGKVYPNFPEKFESPDAAEKKSYKAGNVELKSGSWTFDQAILGNTDGRDQFNGKQAVRMQQNLEEPSLLQMNFDLPNGASKVSFMYGSYYKDPSCTFVVEYSTDGGTTWTRTDNVFNDASKQAGTISIKLNIKGNVRFRINKIGLGSSEIDPSVKNGRLNIDDFAVYQN